MDANLVAWWRQQPEYRAVTTRAWRMVEDAVEPLAWTAERLAKAAACTLDLAEVVLADLGLSEDARVAAADEGDDTLRDGSGRVVGWGDLMAES